MKLECSPTLFTLSLTIALLPLAQTMLNILLVYICSLLVEWREGEGKKEMGRERFLVASTLLVGGLMHGPIRWEGLLVHV